MKGKSKSLLISFIIGAAYSLYVMWYFYTVSGADKATSAEAIGAGIAITLVFPHIFMTVLALLFNAIAYITGKMGFAITCGVLYCVAAGIFPPYALFLVPEIVLSFVGVAKLSKLKKGLNNKTDSNHEPNKNDLYSEIKKAKDLMDSGIITTEEFEAKKKQLLGL